MVAKTQSTNDSHECSGLRLYSAETMAKTRHAFAAVQMSSGLDREPVRDALASIQSEACFYGYPSTARLARRVNELIDSELSDPLILEVVLASIGLLESLMLEPCNVAHVTKTDALHRRIDDLLTGQSRSKTSGSVFRFGSVASSRPVPRSAANQSHEDLDIYSSDIMDGLERCSDEESWIVSQVAAAAEDLAGRRSDIRPAHKLMSILRGHRFFQHMDRVCIVGLMPGANQLVVVDSCIHERLRDQGIKNRMPKGYSCFVNPHGSLFQMKPGVLRIFSDSQSVLESFAKSGRPAQRSIAYVAESGLRSGICLAIGRGDTVQGFLFMNSYQPNLFDQVMRDYAPLLSLFSLMGTVALDAAGFHAIDGLRASTRPLPYPTHSVIFDAEAFRQWLQDDLQKRMAAECSVNLGMEHEDPFLLVPSIVVPVLADLACRSGLAKVGCNSSLDLRVRVDGEQVTMELSGDLPQQVPSGWLESSIQEVADRHWNRPVSIGVGDGRISLVLPYEPAPSGDSGVLYSVAY